MFAVALFALPAPVARAGVRPFAQSATPSRARLAADDSLVTFRLKDQFGAVHDAADYRGRPYFVVAAGRGGREIATAWGALLPRALAEGPAAGAGDGPALASAAVLKIADLRAVPRLLRGLVRGRFPEARRDAVLLDWSGTLAGRLALDGARCTVLAVSAAGRPMLRVVTASADTAEVGAFVRHAGAALAAAARTASVTP